MGTTARGGPLGGYEILITRFAALFHRHQPEPRKGFLHDAGRRPVVRSVKVAQFVWKTFVFQFLVERRKLRVVEVERSYRRKYGKHVAPRRRSAGKPCAVQKHAGSAFALLRECRGDARSSGETRKVKPAIIDGKTRMRVLEHRLRRLRFH